MKYNGKNLNTMEEVFDKALQLAKENKEESKNFFKLYIEYILENNDKNIFNMLEDILIKENYDNN